MEITMEPKLTCKFSCKGCGLKDQVVKVTPRPANMDVLHWMNEVVCQAISDMHTLLSPLCTARTMENLKIPIPKEEEDKNAWIGKYTENIPPDGDITPPKEKK